MNSGVLSKNCAMVTKRNLLLEAAIVWTFAGGILLYRGSVMLTSSAGFSWMKIILCLICGLLFFKLIFSKISRKHVNRIINLQGAQHRFYEFFNSRSYLMMLGMISLGIFLRKSAIVPLTSLSLAYITMGIPLLLSSIRFYHSWFFFHPAINRPK
jgi:uncharacterized membrane protein